MCLFSLKQTILAGLSYVKSIGVLESEGGIVNAFILKLADQNVGMLVNR